MTFNPQLHFVLHEHFASHHHFDFRLERDGVLKSWAVPKGLPEKSGERRLAIAVEDHPRDYIGFQGTIPVGQYGAGEVTIKDTGTYDLLLWTNDRIEVLLHGQNISGKYVFIRFKKAGDKEWLVFRAKDA
jgi:DNA ligase D-like protein (predicted 3'-phosphoesterase)